MIKTILKKFISFNIELSRSIDRRFPGFVETQQYKNVILSIADEFISQRKFCSVLEIGGIDRPLLQRSSTIIYDGLDIEYNKNCRDIYDNFHVQSVEDDIATKYDLIISMTLLEHVKDNTSGLQQIYKALKPNGVSIHYFPSKYHPYSILLRLVGPRWQRKIIKILRPWAASITGYPAYFNKCCPKDMLVLCRQCGFENIEITYFYRANDYFRFCIPCYIAVTCWENMCKKFRLKTFCSGLIILLTKSGHADSS